jgi:hypothetical protein
LLGAFFALAATVHTAGGTHLLQRPAKVVKEVFNLLGSPARLPVSFVKRLVDAHNTSQGKPLSRPVGHFPLLSTTCGLHSPAEMILSFQLLPRLPIIFHYPLHPVHRTERAPTAVTHSYKHRNFKVSAFATGAEKAITKVCNTF